MLPLNLTVPSKGNPSMAYYVVTLPVLTGFNTKNGIDMAVVRANSGNEAKSIIGQYMGDVALWAAGTATQIAAPSTYEGWRFNVVVEGIADVTVTADSDDTLDDIGAKLVTALNATSINGSAYNTGTNVLTIVETTDNMGDKVIAVKVMPPTTSLGDDGVNFTGFWSTLTAPGAVGIARFVTLVDIARAKIYGAGQFRS